MPCLINSQTVKLISQVESFLCPDKQGTPKEGRRIQWPKHCEKNNEGKDNSLKTLTDKNHQASFQKFRQLKFCIVQKVKIFAGIHHECHAGITHGKGACCF